MTRKSGKAKEKLEKVRSEATDRMKKIQEAAERQAEELNKQVKEAEEAAIQAVEDEKKLLEDIENGIKELAKKGDYFCGVVVDADTLALLVKMAIEAKKPISIPFRLYNREDLGIIESETPEVEMVTAESDLPDDKELRIGN